MIIGRHYDYSDTFALLKDDVAVTVYHPTDGSLAVATIGYVGEIYAVNGFNEKGIFMELNNGKPSAGIRSPDSRITGTTMLFSALFEVDELDDWELFFNTVNCSSSYIINVADSRRALSYEWCPIGVKQGGGDLPDGLLVSTNYFINQDWLFPTPSDAASWDGLTRRGNLITLCEAVRGKIDDRAMLEIIGTPLEDGGAMSYEEYEAEQNSTYTNRQLGNYNMTYSLILMILVALTGSYVVASVMEEKTSKLVENLMVSVRPLALIFGKILAMMCYVFSMIVIGAAGSFISNGIMNSVAGPSVALEVSGMLNFSQLFTFAGVKGLIMLPCILLTYLMFSILAGLMGSACIKMEDSASAIGTITMLNMAGYMVGMMLPNFAGTKAMTIASVIPFVSSYIAPVAYICGRVPLWAFLLGLALQIVICVVLFVVCAKTYRKLIVNDSKKIGLAGILKMALKKEVA